MEELEGNKKTEKVIKICSKEEGSMYLLTVKDNGCGIDEKILETLSSKEITMKDGNHLGLGLYFVLDTVENHFDGSLKVESKENVSTEIVFIIPFV
jgi:sensor histidine kinase regulating citrate/malate metabolism